MVTMGTTIFGDADDFECMIEDSDLGNTIKIEKITATSFNKYGDATDTTGTSIEIKAVTIPFGNEDRMVTEGLYRSGDYTFYVPASEEVQCFLARRNKILFTFQKFEIHEILPHMHGDTLFAYEVRTKRI